MAYKHYDISYLQRSAHLLRQLKDESYNSFSEITKGVIVDLGCGTGVDVIELAKKVGPEVEVVGVDHDPIMIEEARMQAAGVGNASFVLSEAYSLPFEDNVVSGLRNERVIQHLRRPEDAVTEIRRVLKASAPLVCVETDWRSLSFYTKHVKTQNLLTEYLTGSKVNNGYSAQRLTSLLDENGFANIRFSVNPIVVTSLEEANHYFRVKEITDECIQNAVFPQGEGADFYGALEKAERGGYFRCAINMVMVSGNKTVGK